MTNPPRFEGLAEDKITWYSNEEQQSTCGSLGLAEDKITWHSNSKMPRLIGPTVWEAEEIAEFSNNRLNGTNLLQGLEGEEITGFSNRKGSFVLCYKYKEIVGHSNLVYVDCAGRTV